MTVLLARTNATGLATPKPLYAQVRDLLLGCIRQGEWGAGEVLPNEFALAARFEVSVGTVRRAVAELESMGVLVRKQGRGTFVSGRGGQALEARFSRLRGSDGRHLVPSYTLQSLRQRAATATERLRLGVGASGGVFEIVQSLGCDGRTIGMECSVLPAVLFPKLETQVLFGQHLYGVLADYGCLVTRVEETVGFAAAEAATAALIGAPSGCPLLSVTRLAIALDEQPVEWRTACYLANETSYACGAT